MKKLMALGILMAGLNVGCSNQWRTTNPGVSSAEVMSMLGEIASTNASQSGSVGAALALKDDPATSVYFAEAENAGPKNISPMGTVQSILSFYNFAFLGLSDLTRDQITGTRVFFLDKIIEGGHETGLIVAIKRGSDGTFNYYGATGRGTVDSGEFWTEMQGDGGSFGLSSYDVDGSDLLETIQLRMYDANGAYNGKFSTLFGFSQQ